MPSTLPKPVVQFNEESGVDAEHAAKTSNSDRTAGAGRKVIVPPRAKTLAEKNVTSLFLLPFY